MDFRALQTEAAAPPPPSLQVETKGVQAVYREGGKDPQPQPEGSGAGFCGFSSQDQSVSDRTSLSPAAVVKNDLIKVIVTELPVRHGSDIFMIVLVQLSLDVLIGKGLHAGIELRVLLADPD